MIIPTDRRLTWEGNVGIPGGVPNRTTIFANVTDAPYNADPTGVADATDAIQDAIDACTSGQVVYIPAGEYRINDQIKLKSNITVRGAGPSLTVLKGCGTTGIQTLVNFGPNDSSWDHTMTDPYTTISSGATKGSTSIVVASATGISVGTCLLIDMIDNDVTVSTTGNGGYCGCCGVRHGQQRHRSQVCLVTNVSGTTITLDQPLFIDYPDSPEAVRFSAQCTMAGLEDLQLYIPAITNDYDQNFHMESCTYCWVKNIESNYSAGDHGWVNISYRCEIRDSYFHDGFTHGPGSSDDTIQFQCGSTSHLVENNIFRRLHVGIMILMGGGGHVIGYNFFEGNYSDSSPDFLVLPTICYHGGSPTFCLMEGNIAPVHNADGVWGTAQYGTNLRNFYTGQQWSWPPYSTRGAEDYGEAVRQVYYNSCVNLAGWARQTYFNFVGNVLGTQAMGPGSDPEFRTVAPTTRDSTEQGYVWTLGYAGGNDDGDDPNDNDSPLTTLLDHGNWDIVNNAQTWDAGIADHDIPDSFYLPSKPSWFGFMAFPPIDPAAPPEYDPDPNVENVPITPAQYRWITGEAPPETDADLVVTTLNATTMTVG